MKEDGEPRRRMSPTSSPVPRLSSAPSAASTVLNITRRSPPHPLATSPRVREGRSPRPLLGDVIATPRHHLATDRPATSSDRAAPRRSAILPTSSSSPSSSILQVVMASQSRRASRREGRERTRAKDAADLFALSSPLFCSVCCLHCPHHVTHSPDRGWFTPSGSCRDTISPPLHRPATGTGGPLPELLPASSSPSGR